MRKSAQLAARLSRKLDDMFNVDVIVKDESSKISLIHQDGMQGIRL